MAHTEVMALMFLLEYTWVINYANKETDDKKVITGTINLIR